MAATTPLRPKEPHCLSVAKEFSRTPGPRTRAEGDYSAQQFVAEFLAPAFERAVKEDVILLVDLDGGYGYGTSFLEETFGGLARLYGIQKVLAHIDVKSEEEAYLRDDTLRYIREALTGGRGE